ncbi:MAG: DUF418 domain-containing protein [Candidatus Zixiibacteriota bacterium]|nr:MAG: DUF418 domain-containing protein [candidate division Zixibacteria bacterium]
MSGNSSQNSAPTGAQGEGLSAGKKPLGPVQSPDRIKVIDVLRGAALLGILVINIDFFALPSVVLFNPTVAGGFTGLELLAWKFSTVFFLEKMMALFSMLFGAGLILMYDRAVKAGRKLGGIYYRRMLWLALIGAAHAYLLWFGDILFSYAIAGLVIFLFRKRSARTLIIVGCFVLIFGALLKTGAGFATGLLKSQAEGVEKILSAGGAITPDQQGILDAWHQTSEYFYPEPETLAEEIAAYRGSYAEAFAFRLPMTIMMQTQALVFMVLWRVLGLMLIGMGLLKMNFLSGERSRKFYVVWIIVGYGLGLPLCIWGMTSLIDHQFDIIRHLTVDSHFNYMGSVLMAVGNIGIIVLVYQAGGLKRLTERLAAVGQMALTNYLLHSIIATTIFYGYGLGLFGQVGRFSLWGFTLGIWVLQIWLSPIWLRHFRFGPAEWLWRSLTYWKIQPMRLPGPN